VNNVLAITGYADVKLAIDGKLRSQVRVTSTGTISASNVTTSGILNIAGYSDVKLAIGAQPTLTGSSNITTEQSNASNVTASGILNIAGYTDVKVAIDGKQPTLTGSSNITTGTINATNVTASGNIDGDHRRNRYYDIWYGRVGVVECL
jgi:hypothetical protein